MKQQPGKDMHAVGGAALVGSLMNQGLIDELRLVVCPIVLGGGKTLFKDVTVQGRNGAPCVEVSWGQAVEVGLGSPDLQNVTCAVAVAPSCGGPDAPRLVIATRQEEASMASQTTVEPRRTYLPAAGHDWWLPLYDPIVTLLGGDPTRRVLVEQAAIQPSHRVLEVGCGTGSLVLLVKRLHPGVDVVGLDPDPRALARARRKAA